MNRVETKKKIRQYLPLEVNVLNDDDESILLKKCGLRGLGLYLTVLMELRNCSNYRCNLDVIEGKTKRFNTRKSFFRQVIYDFHLFEITREGEEEFISSPYLDRVMEAYDEKHRRLSEAAKKRTNKSKRDSKGCFTDAVGALDKIRLDNTTATAVKEKAGAGGDAPQLVFNAGGEAPRPDFNAAGVELKHWETCLDTAVRDEAWMEILAASSGMSRLFMKHRAAVTEAFRQHVRLQGNEAGIRSVADAKAYFANFMRQGAPTQKRMATRLAELEEETKQTSTHPYETVDPQTGERSYFGNPIPVGAPPRPNDNAVWSEKLGQWI